MEDTDLGILAWPPGHLRGAPLGQHSLTPPSTLPRLLFILHSIGHCQGQGSVQVSNGRTILSPTVEWTVLMDSAMSDFSMVGQCCVRLFNGWTGLYPTVQWTDNAVSKCPMVRLSCVQLCSNYFFLCCSKCHQAVANPSCPFNTAHRIFLFWRHHYL